MNNTICHYCKTEYEGATWCPLCHHRPIDKSGAANGLKPQPIKVRGTGFPFKLLTSPRQMVHGIYNPLALAV